MFGPPKDPNELTYWEQQKALQRGENTGSGGSGHLGFLGLPLLIPTLLIFGGMLYPLTALVTLAVWYAGRAMADLLHLPDFPAAALAYIPATAVMWIGCRWDTWMGQNKGYYWARHVVRNLLFVLLLILMASHDSSRGKTDTQILAWFFSNDETLGVTVVALIAFNYVVLGPPGVIKSFWHEGMELARLRPKELPA